MFRSLRSLRVQLPLIFLAGIVLAGVVTTPISVRLFQQFAHDQAVSRLSREAHGIAALYTNAIKEGYGNAAGDRKAPTFAAANLRLATGAKLYWIGPNQPFPGQQANLGLPRLPEKTIDWTSGKSLAFEFTPPGANRQYIAVANPLIIRATSVGAVVVAQPKTDISKRVHSLIERLALAGLLGLAVAGLLAWYLSRRIVRPVLQLSRAADDVAAGNYDVRVPPNAPGELGHLSERFDEMAHRLAEVEAMERNFLMSVSHELRAADRDPRHVSALLEGDRRPELGGSLETVEAGHARAARRGHRTAPRHPPLPGEPRSTWSSSSTSLRDTVRGARVASTSAAGERNKIESDGDRVLVRGNLLATPGNA
jgi:HAMP domain-containing protein